MARRPLRVRKLKNPKELPTLSERRNPRGYYEIIYRTRTPKGASVVRRMSTFESSKPKAMARFLAWKKAMDGTEEGGTQLITVHKALDFWFRKQIKARKAPSMHQAAMAVKFLKGFFDSNKLVVALNQRDIAEYIEARKSGMITGNRVTSSPVKREINQLKAAINFCVTEGRMKQEDVPVLRSPPENKPRERVLTKDELNRIFQRAYDDPDCGSTRLGRMYRFLVLLYFTMSRKGAIQKLRWEQIDLKAGVIYLNPKTRAQTRKRRATVPISDKLMPILLQMYKERVSAWVLDTPDFRTENRLKTILSNLKIEGVTAHTFRHTAATNAIKSGADLMAVAAMMGDTPATVKRHYLHHDMEFLKDAAADKL